MRRITALILVLVAIATARRSRPPRPRITAACTATQPSARM